MLWEGKQRKTHVKKKRRRVRLGSGGGQKRGGGDLTYLVNRDDGKTGGG